MSVAAAVQSIKSATDIVKGIAALSKDVAVNTKAMELLTVISTLQQQIIDLQTKYEALSRSEQEWKQKAVHQEEWSKTKRGYSRNKLAAGATVYISNADTDMPDSAEWYCVHCMDINKVESVLQLHKESFESTDYICPNCKNHVVVPSELGGSLFV